MRVTRHGVLCTSSPRPPLGGRPLWQRPPSSSEVLMAHPRADLFHVSRADLFGDLRPNLLSSDPREGFEFFFRQDHHFDAGIPQGLEVASIRSEEHTSELPSLMRI